MTNWSEEIRRGEEFVNLGDRNIGDDDAKEIARALTTALEPGGNKIGTEDTKEIAWGLTDPNTTCKRLWLWGNNIGDRGAKAIAEALDRNSTLTHLYLDKNNIGHKGAVAIASALERNVTLEKLDLSARKPGRWRIGGSSKRSGNLEPKGDDGSPNFEKQRNTENKNQLYRPDLERQSPGEQHRRHSASSERQVDPSEEMEHHHNRKEDRVRNATVGANDETLSSKHNSGGKLVGMSKDSSRPRPGKDQL